MEKIEDNVFKIPMGLKQADDMILEFYVCKTNELNPHREIRELGVVIYEGNKASRESSGFRQLDNSNEFDVEEIEKLIKYLHKVKKHIKKFNENSKPTE